MLCLAILSFLLFFGNSSCQGCINTRCSCSPSGDIVRCNGRSINAVVGVLRALGESTISAITQISFVTPPETVLPAGTFTNFTSLVAITICCSRLATIEPGAFDTLSQLIKLDLRDNHLQFLSANSLIGTSSSLATLQLSNNQFVNLRSDLLPIFSSIRTLLELQGNRNFSCDCHLHWLVDFVNNANLASTVTADMLCQQPLQAAGLAIIDPTVDFNLAACGDICSSSYHSCAANATCSISSNGMASCSCISGYTGNGFTCVLSDPCVFASCHQNATCTFDNQGNTSCTCEPGLTGDGFDCTTPDPCYDVLCHSNATCSVSSNGMVSCSCISGYAGNGFTCVLSDPCVFASCHQNATCTFDNQGNTSCTCEPGFTGDGFDCTTPDPCYDVLCHSNATCSVSSNRMVSCSCISGYAGNGFTCVLSDPCVFASCHQNATCTFDNQGNTSCTCEPGFTGDGFDCTTPDPCYDVLCHSNATCSVSSNGMVSCSCISGYAGNGFTCVLSDPCVFASCHQNATCTFDNQGNTSCTCEPGFTGDGFDCTTPDPCYDVLCHSNATCSVSSNRMVSCSCISGYAGNGFTCVLSDPCVFASCHQNATCTFDNQGNTSCTCEPGFTGDGFDCTTPDPCYDVLCHSNATCSVSSNGMVSCSCISGYAGNGFTCVLSDPCVFASCHQNATCTFDNQGNTSCTCEPGLTGDGFDCTTPDPCYDVLCHSNATCSVSSNGMVSCSCNSGYTGNGSTCAIIDPCMFASCHQNATCTFDNQGNTSCTCEPGLTGDGFNCTTLDPCYNVLCHSNATCTFDNQGNTSCTCEPGLTGDGFNCATPDPCYDVLCHSNATCSVSSNGMVSCSCISGYAGNGSTCILSDPCMFASCHQNATCIFDNQGNTSCTCEPGLTGDGFNCTTPDPCYYVLCHSNATCTSDSWNQNGICMCNEGFTGDGMNCTVMDPCLSQPCHSNATCFSSHDNQNAMCVCIEGFIGNGWNCEEICKSVQCHMNATCIPDNRNQIGSCVCDPGYTGTGHSCSPLSPCSACHLNATCISNMAPQSPMCTCNHGFTGDGRNCTLIDYCESVTCGLNAMCEVNLEGGSGILCQCADGHLGDPTVMCITRESCDLSCGIEGVVCVGGEGERGTTCVSFAVQSLQQQLTNLAMDTSSDPGLILFTSSLLNSTIDTVYPGDLPVLVSLFQDSLQYLNNPSPTTVQNLVRLGSEFLDNSKIPLWDKLSQTEVSKYAGQLLTSLQSVGHAVFLSTNATGETIYSSTNVALVVIRPNCSARGDTVVSSSALGRNSDQAMSERGSTNNSISLPSSVFGTGTGCSMAGLVVVIYDGIGPLLSSDQLLPNNNICPTLVPRLAHGQCAWYNDTPSCSNQTVEGVVFTASVIMANMSAGADSVSTVDTSMLREPVRITFEHQELDPEGDPPACAFLNEQRLGLEGESWLTERCQAVQEESSPTHTVCECYHLTSFALLVSPTRSMSDNRPLQIVSKVGLCISIICLVLTILLLFILRLETKHLHQIHRQLAIALCLAQVIFLVGVDRRVVPSPDAVCTTIAVLLHYLFLCAFAWQLVEGVHLYLLIVRVFYNEKVVWLYYPLSWGLPAIVVAVTVGIKFCDYGSQDFCWINGDSGTNWAFNGPVLAVLAVNLVIMFIVMVKLIQAARTNEKDTCLLCTLVHSSMVLLPILGIGWVLGFLVVGEGAIFDVIEWLFSIFTTLQGTMIFIMHCVLNKEVRKAFLKGIGCHEAAKKQATVHDMRRTSMAYIRRKSSVGMESTKNLRLFPLKKSHTIDSIITDDSTDIVLPPGFSSTRPSISASVDLKQGHLHQISEEGSGYSLPNSVPGTPETGSKHNIVAHEDASPSSSVNNSSHQLIKMSTE